MSKQRSTLPIGRNFDIVAVFWQQSLERCFEIVAGVDGVLEMRTGMETAGIPRNPRISRGYKYECCGNTAGMDLTIEGFPRRWILLRREPRWIGRRIRTIF